MYPRGVFTPYSERPTVGYLHNLDKTELLCAGAWQFSENVW